MNRINLNPNVATTADSKVERRVSVMEIKERIGDENQNRAAQPVERAAQSADSKVESHPARVWTLTAGDHNVVSRDDTGFIANCIKAKVPGFADFYWLTEKEAIEKAIQFRRAEEDRLYAERRELMKRLDEIEEQEMKEQGY